MATKRKQPEGESASSKEKKARTSSTLPETVKTGVDTLMGSFREKANNIIAHTLPAKALKLTELHKKMQQSKPSPVVFNASGVPTNEGVVALLAPMKAEVKDLVELTGDLEMWIQLNIPKIQDQKGIGVSVKEEIAEMVHSGKQAGLQVFEAITKYFIRRANLVVKCLKWPQAPDYRVALQDLDEKMHANLITMAADLRNNYLIILDSITKNHERISQITETSQGHHLWY